MSFVALSGAVLLIAFLAAVLREARSPLVPYVAAAGCLFLFFYLTPVFAEGKEAIASFTGVGDTHEILSVALRAVGIAFLSEVAEGVCRDLGEGATADRLTLAARGAVILLALPTVVEILSLAVEYAKI